MKVENGLSQSSVNAVLKDRKGYYWIATQYGLNKFDGKTIRVFNTGNTPHLSDNFILKGVEDGYGNIWWATRHNLCRYSISTETFHTVVTDTINGTIKGHSTIWFLDADREGNIVFSAAGKIFKINKANLNAASPTFSPLTKAIFVCSSAFYDDSFFYTTFVDTLFKYSYVNGNYKLLSKKVQASWAKNNGHFITQCNNKSFILCNNKLFMLHQDSVLELFKDVFNQTKINAVLQFESNYYIGTDDGLYEFNEKYVLLGIHKNAYENSNSLAEDKILSISSTNDSLLWVGNANTGVNCYDIHTSKFQIIKHDNNKPYLSFASTLDNDSNLLVGTTNGVDVFIWKNNKWKWQTNFFNAYKVTALCALNNKLIIGTTKGLFVKMANQLTEINLPKKQTVISDIKLNSAQQLVVSTLSGFYLLEPITHKLLHQVNKTTTDKINALKTDYLFSSSIGKFDTYYLNSTVGVAQLDSNCQFEQNVFTNYPYKSLSEIMITKTIEESPNTFWFSTLGNGVYYYANKQFKQFNQLTGLSNNVVSAMEKDNQGNIWVSTNYGINCISKQHQIKSFVDELTIASPEFIVNASYFKNNQLFFCSNDGVIAFNPEKVLSTKLPETLQLTINSVIKNYSDTLQINDSTINLKNNDKFLSLNLCVPSYRYFNRIQLTYLVKGFTEKWMPLENGKNLQLSNLPFGKYDLMIKATLPQSNWQQLVQLKLNVTPPFWRTTWFIIIMSLLVVIVISFLVWYASRIKLKKQLAALQLQQAIHEEKEQISRDLHDNIGSQISTLIMGLDRITLTQQASNAERLSDYARQTLSELRETIWALNSQTMDLDTLKQKLEELIFEWRSTYENIAIPFETHYSENRWLNPEHSLAFFRIIQEAANNALKHSECTILSIQLHLKQHQLMAYIIDNGKGFDTSSRKKGHYGLDNMSVRAQRANIEYKIESQLLKGTEIHLTLTIA